MPYSMDKKYLWLLLAISLTGALIAALVMSRYGPGVSADATKYLSISQNLLDGKGFFDHTGRPLLWWPPLYPLEIAGVSRLTGLDVLFAASWLNIITFAANIFLNGALVYYAFPDKPLRQFLGALFILTSDMAIRIHANISSEPLFVTFSMIFLFASADYLQTRSRRALWWMIAMSALAPLQRYLGASLIAAGGCFILFAHRRDIWRGIRESFLFGVLSLIPIAAWIGFHNIGKYNSFWGVSGSIVNPLENLRLSLAKILHWFIPNHPALQPLFDNPWIVVGIIAVILLLLNKKENWKTFAWTMMQPIPFVSWAFFAWTILGLMYSVTTEDHVDLFSDRYYVGLLSLVLVMLFVTFDSLILPHLKWNQLTLQKLGAAVFFLWLAVYPAWSLVKYVSASMQNGEASGYNVYNNRAFHENPIIKAMQRIAIENPDATLYSNYTDGVWFFTRRESPIMPRSFTMELDEIKQNYSGWPHDKPGYIIWILPNSIYRNAVPPKLLAEIADLELVVKIEEGEIYKVALKK
ncbi:MAG: hypothetical protein IPM31_01730 [Anaerolineae bacterium]|nr:hypothetical protein [Anaerolineae bacterium]MCC7190880.1 hypothetical protein [Anaerolineales bacterium]